MTTQPQAGPEEEDPRVACTACDAETSPLAVFPGGICLDCYKKTPEARAPLTAADIRRMWGMEP